MRHAKPFVLFCALLALVIATVAGSAARASQAAVHAPLISTLSSDERLHLPDSTKVTVNGHVVTLADVRAAHTLRQHEFEQAAMLGHDVATKIHSQTQLLEKNQTLSGKTGGVNTLTVSKTTEHELRYQAPSPGMYVGVVGHWNPSPSPSPKSRAIVPIGPIWRLFSIIPIPQATLQKYAKDYQDFCTAAQATACVYLPQIQSWQMASSSNIVGNYYTLLSVVDPLVTDTGLCQSENGTMGQSGCIYTYPYVETTDYTPSSTNTYVMQCPGYPNGWNIMMDSHGAASIATPGIGAAWNTTATATCVIQVYA